MEKEPAWMENVWGVADHVGPDVLIWAGKLASSSGLSAFREEDKLA